MLGTESIFTGGDGEALCRLDGASSSAVAPTSLLVTALEQVPSPASHRRKGGLAGGLALLAAAVVLVGCLACACTALGAGDVNEALCPNESFTGFTPRLPECRAYEMVTPSYKEGYPLLVGSFAANGNQAILFTLANLGAAGAGESPIEGDLYLATRTTHGWQLSGLNAPLSEFIGQLPITWEATSGATLWEQHGPLQSAFTRDLYARSANGEYRLIGQISIPFMGENTQEANYIYQTTLHVDQPRAATHDFNHIVVSASTPEDRLPFDETLGAESLYEYSGTDNPPATVGAEGNKGETHLVSQCGTTLGSSSSGSGSTYNALSADGETIYFTAEPKSACNGRGPETAEVYARIHGSMLSSLPAKTVDVSASECTEACGTTKSSKNFEGASEDGQIVYFTSTQKLTNNAMDGTASGEAYMGSGCANTTPGAGGCNLYVYDFADPSEACQAHGDCLKLVAGGEVEGVAGIAEDGQRIYYVKRSNEGSPDLYVYDLSAGALTLVAHLGGGDSAMWQKMFVKPAEVAGEDGQFLLFQSATPGLTADEGGSAEQLFEYDAVTEELVRITKGENGYDDDGNGVQMSVESIAGYTAALGFVYDFKSEANRLTISPDGRTVVFQTNGKLSPFATSAEECPGVYEFHTDGPLSAGKVSLLSDGQDVYQAGPRCGTRLYRTSMDASGDNILFGSIDPLVSSDGDGGQRDVYDARVEGGFPPAPSLTSCGSSSCEGVVSTPPTPIVPSSASAKGSSGTESPQQQILGKPKPKPTLTNRQKLAKALRSCHRKRSRAKRVVCERGVRRTYGKAR